MHEHFSCQGVKGYGEGRAVGWLLAFRPLGRDKTRNTSFQHACIPLLRSIAINVRRRLKRRGPPCGGAMRRVSAHGSSRSIGAAVDPSVATVSQSIAAIDPSVAAVNASISTVDPSVAVVNPSVVAIGPSLATIGLSVVAVYPSVATFDPIGCPSVAVANPSVATAMGR